MIILNGQQADSIEFNGVNLDKIIFNGVIVFEKSTEDHSTTIISVENRNKSTRTINLIYTVEEPTVYINGYVLDSSSNAVNYVENTTGQKTRSFTIPSYSTYIIEMSGGKISEHDTDSSMFLEGNIYAEAFLGTNIESCGGWLIEPECGSLTIAADIPINIEYASNLKTLTIIGPHVIESISNLEGPIESITIPAGSTIRSGAFYFIPEVQEIHILGSTTVLNDGMFSSCYSLSDIYVHSTIPAASKGQWFSPNTQPTIHLSSTLDIEQAKVLFGSKFNIITEARDEYELTTLFDL